MATVTFDKSAYVESLKAAGISDPRAHAIALDDALKDTVATKADISELRSEMQAIELRMTIKMGSMLFVAFGAVIAAIRLIPH